MIELTLGILLLILIGLGLVEAHFHRLALASLPIRIHVNGSRGKSSVTRLIAAGLRASGLKTLAKTTGTSPRIIDEQGRDRIIHRLRDASIGEQVRLLEFCPKETGCGGSGVHGSPAPVPMGIRADHDTVHHLIDYQRPPRSYR